MSQTPNTAAPAAPSRRGKLLRGLFAIVVLLLAALVLWYFMFGRWFEETDDAYVQGNQVQITPLVSGTVVAIAADDGMRVERGQLLVQLDPADTEVALQQAEANLAGTVRQVRGLYRSVEGAQADLNARQVTLKRMRADYARRKDLADTGAISSEELAHARDELASAEAAVAGSRETVERSRALVDDTVIATQPDVQAAAAQLRQAWLNNARAGIVSPVSGYVARRSVQVGQRVQPGNALMAVVPGEQMWVEANFKETQLRHMRLGQEVELRADLYGGDVGYKGRVTSLGMGTGSAFSLLPAQNASGNWIKIVQRVPVRIAIDAKQLAEHPLRIGLSMKAEVSLRDQEGTVLPVEAAKGNVFDTDVYAKQLHDADDMIHTIIQGNLPQSAAASAATGPVATAAARQQPTTPPRASNAG
ncbi:biotin/lipoyl-binding protein [Stenotrophomonas tumulicola]